MIIALLILIVLIMVFGRKAVLAAFGKLGLWVLILVGLTAAVVTIEETFGKGSFLRIRAVRGGL